MEANRARVDAGAVVPQNVPILIETDTEPERQGVNVPCAVEAPKALAQLLCFQLSVVVQFLPMLALEPDGMNVEETFTDTETSVDEVSYLVTFS